MAMETLVVGKCGNASTPVELIKGDNCTQKIMMRVPRYFGGVDLAPLAWSVTVENAAGATDEYALSAIRGEDAIEMEWIPGGTATAVPGITKFKLSGFGEDRNILVWQSGTYHLRVKDTFSHTPGSETAAALTDVQKLIIYVDGELNRVIRAADAAEAAAEAANRAADRAEGTANGTRIAALEKFTTEPENYSVTGNMVQLDNYSGMPMHCVTHIEPVQAGSGDPSPSNVRPISGFTGAKLTRCGKNLVSNTATTQTVNGVTFTVNADGSVVANGTNSLSSMFTVLVGRFNMLASTKYILSGSPASDAISLTLRDRYGNNTYASDGGWSPEFMVDKGDDTASLFIRVAPNATVDNLTLRPMIRLASETDAAYEPYQGDTVTANFGQTVYGGTMDWNTGVLTVDRAIVEIIGNESFVLATGGKGRFTYWDINTTVKPWADAGSVAPIRCSHLRTISASELYNSDTNYSVAQNNNEIWFSDTNFSSVDDFKAFLAAQYATGTPVQLCYELAAPTVIQLTPAQITALQGMNNIWCDAGETTVSGRKDILWLTDYLIDRIKALETAIISTGGNV